MTGFLRPACFCHCSRARPACGRIPFSQRVQRIFGTPTGRIQRFLETPRLSWRHVPFAGRSRCVTGHERRCQLHAQTRIRRLSSITLLAIALSAVVPPIAGADPPAARTTRTLESRVSLADLDLSTAEGVRAAHKRLSRGLSPDWRRMWWGMGIEQGVATARRQARPRQAPQLRIKPRQEIPDHAGRAAASLASGRRVRFGVRHDAGLSRDFRSLDYTQPAPDPLSGAQAAGFRRETGACQVMSIQNQNGRSEQWPSDA